MAPGNDIGEWALRGLGTVPAFSLKHAHGLKCCQPGQGWKEFLAGTVTPSPTHPSPCRVQVGGGCHPRLCPSLQLSMWTQRVHSGSRSLAGKGAQVKGGLCLPPRGLPMCMAVLSHGGAGGVVPSHRY